MVKPGPEQNLRSQTWFSLAPAGFQNLHRTRLALSEGPTQAVLPRSSGRRLQRPSASVHGGSRKKLRAEGLNVPPCFLFPRVPFAGAFMGNKPRRKIKGQSFPFWFYIKDRIVVDFIFI